MGGIRAGLAKEAEQAVSDPYTDRLINLGLDWDKEMAYASIDRCNCMVRYRGGSQLPAIRRGKEFFTAEGNQIDRPTSFEDMVPRAIKKLMVERGEIYIGHMFTPAAEQK